MDVETKDNTTDLCDSNINCIKCKKLAKKKRITITTLYNQINEMRAKYDSELRIILDNLQAIEGKMHGIMINN